ncbi:MAG: twin-arginine translocase subunit TatA, partial [Gammaproteobacteria bacterium]|nr:twin-arginine translocase subunit TatA [Gammaproteobacteria bacterium]
TKRLKNIGSDLGNAVKGFKGAVTDSQKEAEKEKLENSAEESVIDGEVTEKEVSEDKNKS